MFREWLCYSIHPALCADLLRSEGGTLPNKFMIIILITILISYYMPIVKLLVRLLRTSTSFASKEVVAKRRVDVIENLLKIMVESTCSK